MPSHLLADGDDALLDDGRYACRSPTLSLNGELRRNLQNVRQFHDERLEIRSSHLRTLRRSLQNMCQELRTDWWHGRVRKGMSSLRTKLSNHGGREPVSRSLYRGRFHASALTS